MSLGAITPGGVAAQDGRLLMGDELLYVDGQSVVGSSHKKVVSLMIAAGQAGRVSLGIRRKVQAQQPGQCSRTFLGIIVQMCHFSGNFVKSGNSNYVSGNMSPFFP